MKKALPIDPRLQSILQGLLFSLGLALIGQSLARWLQIHLSAEASLLWHPALALATVLVWAVASPRRGQDRALKPLYAMGWPLFWGAIAVGLAGLLPGFVDAQVPPDGKGWGTVFGPLAYCLSLGLPAGILVSLSIRHLSSASPSGGKLIAPWFFGAGLGYGGGLLWGSLVLLGTESGAATVRMIGSAILILSCLLLASMRVATSSTSEESTQDSSPPPEGANANNASGSIGYWLISVAAGLAVAAVWREVGLPSHGGFLGRQLVDSVLPIGFALGCVAVMIRQGLRGLKPSTGEGVSAALMGLGIVISFELGSHGRSPVNFELLLQRLEIGTTSTSYLLGQVIPSLGTLLVGAPLAYTWLGLTGAKFAWAALLSVLSFGVGLAFDLLGLASGLHLVILALLFIFIPAIMTVFSTRKEVGGMSRLATGGLMVLFLAIGAYSVSQQAERNASAFEMSSRKGLLGEVAVRQDLGAIFVDQRSLPDVAGSSYRAVLSSQLHRLHSDAADKSMVIETIAGASGAQLSALGFGSVGVTSLLDLEAQPRRAARKRLAPIIDGNIDLIIQEPVNPSRPESATIHSLEHFRLLSEKISPEGSVVLWVSLSRMRWDSLGILARTFSRAFESTTVWLGEPFANEPTIAFLGRRQVDSHDLNWSRIRTSFDEHPRREVVERFGLGDPFDVFRHYLGDELFIGESFSDRRENRDLSLVLETAELRRFEPDINLGLENRLRAVQDKEDLVGRIRFESIEPKVRADHEHQIRRQSAALVKAFQARSVLLRAGRARVAPQAFPDSPRILEERALALLRDGWGISKEDRYVTAVVVEFLDSLMAQGRYEDAQIQSGDASVHAPSVPSIFNINGLALMAQSRDREARNSFERALRLDPENPDIHSNLGLANFLLGESERARDEFQKARHLAGGLPPLSSAILSVLEGEERAESLMPYLDQEHPLFGRRLAKALADATAGE